MRGRVDSVVKETTNNKISAGTLLLCTALLFIFLNGCAGMKGKGVALKNPGEPVLVSPDTNYMIWCGPDALIYIYTERDVTRYVEDVVYWYDVYTGRRVLIGKETEDIHIAPMACTPDGKWLVYLNKGSLRWDESGVNVILDVWRYEVSTGRHEKIAITRDIAGFDKGILSPDGKKLFLGEKPLEEVEMPEPKWEIVWSELQDVSDALWFRDSSAVFTYYWGRRDSNGDMVIEAISPERKTVIFNPDELNDFNLFYSDKRGRIYMYFWNSNEKRHVVRCNVDPEEKSVSCEDVFVEGDHTVEDLEVFSDGEFIAFTEDDGRCVKAIGIGGKKARCITPLIDTLGNYRTPSGMSIRISPDDKWLAFDLIRQDETGEGIGEDLYIIELNKD